MKKKIKIEYTTQVIYGVQIVCKEFVPKDFVFTVGTPDEHGVQQVVITKLEEQKCICTQQNLGVEQLKCPVHGKVKE